MEFIAPFHKPAEVQEIKLPGFAELLRHAGESHDEAWSNQHLPQLNLGSKCHNFPTVSESRREASKAVDDQPMTRSCEVTTEHFKMQPDPEAKMGCQVGQAPHSLEHDILLNGWLDTDNWLFKIVWDAAKDYSVDELTEKFFGRKARPVYGETHKSSFRRKDSVATSVEDQYWHKNAKEKSKENHQQQERHRRKRHRVLQRESDRCVGDFIFELANDKLPHVKSIILEMFPEDDNDTENGSLTGRGGSSHACVSAKNTGKDENLLSAVFTHLFSAIVVLKQHRTRLETQQKLQETEAENRELRERLSQLICQDPNSSFANPDMDTLSRKRPVSEIYNQDGRCKTDATKRLSLSPHLRDKRRILERADAEVSNVAVIRPQLPPSPTPSLDAGLIT